MADRGDNTRPPPGKPPGHLQGNPHDHWQYGGLKANDAKRLKELESENSRLKKLVANQALDIDMLREVSKGNY